MCHNLCLIILDEMVTDSNSCAVVMLTELASVLSMILFLVQSCRVFQKLAADQLSRRVIAACDHCDWDEVCHVVISQGLAASMSSLCVCVCATQHKQKRVDTHCVLY